MASYAPLLRDSSEPVIEDLEELRLHRKRQTALGYRCFGALRYGQLGDGHITARDPILTDHFWALGLWRSFQERNCR